MRFPTTFGTLFILLLFTGFSLTESPRFMANNYEEEWRLIDSLDKEGLPRSALERVEALYARAKRENNPAQVIKTLIYQGKYFDMLEEDGKAVAIQRLEKELESLDFPALNVMQSALGEVYGHYIDANLWRLRDRTDLADYRPDDLQTWSLPQLAARADSLFRASVDDRRLLDLPIGDFAAITADGKNTDQLRPSLYDFLAHRAIDHFLNDRYYLTAPADKFELRDPVVFAPAAAFARHDFGPAKRPGEQYQALRLLQDLIRRRLNDAEPSALIDADLKRLRLAHDKAIVEQKDSLYLQALESLREKYARHEAAAEILAHIAQVHYHKGREYEPFSNEKPQWEIKKARELCETCLEKYPKAYGAPQCRSLLEQIRRPELEMMVEEVNLPGRPFPARLEYRNVKQATFRLIALSEADRDSLENKNLMEMAGYLRQKKSLREWSQALIDVGDHQRHAAEMKIDAAPLGLYAMLVGDEKSFNPEKNIVGVVVFHVSNLGYFSRRDENNRTEFVLVDRQNGAALEGVKAEFFTSEYNYSTRRSQRKKIGEAKSDAQGFIRPSLPQQVYYQVKFSKGDDVQFFGDGFSNYSRSSRRRDQQTTHFFLDRAIYRPGQTIYFKGIALEKDDQERPRIIANEPVKVTLYDVNRQEVASLNLRSNEYGAFNGAFQAPGGGLRGAMYLGSSIGASQQVLRVEEYKRPRFEVSFEPLAGDPGLGDTISLRGKALNFAGSAVDGALVQFRVTREVYFPWWPWWRGAWIIPPRGETMEIANGVLETDEKGYFTVTFPAIPDASIYADQKPAFHFTVRAEVTDMAGETQSGSRSVRLAYLGLETDVELSERIDRRRSAPWTLSARNLDGAPAEARGTLAVYRLEAPRQVFVERYWPRPDQYILDEKQFRAAFPLLAYRDEDQPAAWKRAEKVLEQDFRFEGSDTLQPALSQWPVGHYEAHLLAADSKGQPIEIKKFFVLYDAVEGKLPENIMGWHHLAEKTFQPGEKAAFSLATAAAPLHILFEVERREQIVEQRWMKVDNWTSVEYALTEADRGNIQGHVTYVRHNRAYSHNQLIVVPWSNKELTIEYETFRDKLRPGEEEEWRLKISGPAKEKVAAEMVATLYDASLDQFAPHNWYFSPFPNMGHAARRWSSGHFASVGAQVWTPSPERLEQVDDARVYRRLNWFGWLDYWGWGRPRFGYYQDAANMQLRTRGEMPAIAYAAAPPAMEEAAEAKMMDAAQVPPPARKEGPEAPEAPGEMQVRTNLNETVFFLPSLRTDAEGRLVVAFKMNEALTRWKFMALAHTTDLKFAHTSREVVTQKELMVLPNAPRFVREGDEIEFTARVSNLSEMDQTGKARLQLFDALTLAPVDKAMGNTTPEAEFRAAPGQSAALTWKLRVPKGEVQLLTYRVTAQAGLFSDGEESAIPVLTNRQLVTETMPITLKGGERKNITFERLAASGQSTTLQHHNFTLSFTANPAWYAVKALPYLMEYPHECVEQIFGRLYANTLAAAVVEAHPRIQTVFDRWRASGEALQSELMRNQELKAVLLEETPWVLQAQSETQQRRNMALLFDLNRMRNEREGALRAIVERQMPSGGFSWFPGGRESWYITQYIVEGMGRLERLGVKTGPAAQEMIASALDFIDRQMLEEYQRLRQRPGVKLEEDHLSAILTHYLYARSFFLDAPRPDDTEEAFQYYLGQARQHWNKKPVYEQGMVALALWRYQDQETPTRVARSLRERALRSDELGMYWKYQSGFFWNEHPIETHALLMEVFAEVAKDGEALEELKLWLLRNKQTNHWKTTKATASAVYALFNGDRGLTRDWLAETKPAEITFVNLKKKEYQETLQEAQKQAEVGTGYFQAAWKGVEVNKNMGDLRVRNPNQGIVWGSMYWQYFEDLDKITRFEDTPLKLSKQLFLRAGSDTGPQLRALKEGESLAPGDLLMVRVELRVDRPMEYVHMKDLRASGLEPVNVLSQYKWQGGLGYYESTGDAATHFFFDYLPRGTYVFEYPLRVAHRGDFSYGITSIQCMYAPEFSSHSAGGRIRVAPREQ
jgi:uncharacterized protein YfaS (alpha-2-macroglobulin family)